MSASEAGKLGVLKHPFLSSLLDASLWEEPSCEASECSDLIFWSAFRFPSMASRSRNGHSGTAVTWEVIYFCVACKLSFK